MGIFLIAFAALGLVILTLHVVVTVGLVVNFIRDALRRSFGALPTRRTVEVIVAVRDEEATLAPLLSSLAAQTDPECLFLFVDDRSTDGTRQLLETFAGSIGPRARIIQNYQEPLGLTGKQAALDLAFHASRGDILLFTDGDCVVPSDWVRRMRGYFEDPSTGAVLGRIELDEGNSFLSRFQAFEQPLINQYNFGMAGLGFPMGCFGNNMAVRAEVIREIGGFARLGYSVTEDAALVAAVGRAGKWKVKVSISGDTAAVTIPKTGWAAYVNQHTRWNAGAFFARDIGTRASYGLIVGYLIFCVLVLPLSILDWRIPILSLNAFLSIGLVGAMGGFYAGKRKGRYFARLVPYTLFFGFFYTFVSLRALLQRPLEWKGAALTPKGPGG